VLEVGSTDGTSATWSNGVLTVDPPGGPVLINLAGNYGSTGFSAHSDSLGGTNVVLAGGSGDVHMTTLDGLRYDFNAVGDFVAEQSTEPGNPWEFQIRTASWAGFTSITTELAAELGDARVTVALGRANPLYVNGTPDTLGVGEVQSFEGGTLSRLSPNSYRLAWSAGESVTVTDVNDTYLDWTVGLGPQNGPGSVHGLLGSGTGQAMDFQLPDGTVLAQPLSEQEILGVFADAWRVAPGASLFDDTFRPAPTGSDAIGSLLPANSPSAGDLFAPLTASPFLPV